MNQIRMLVLTLWFQSSPTPGDERRTDVSLPVCRAGSGRRVQQATSGPALFSTRMICNLAVFANNGAGAGRPALDALLISTCHRNKGLGSRDRDGGLLVNRLSLIRLERGGRASQLTETTTSYCLVWAYPMRQRSLRVARVSGLADWSVKWASLIQTRAVSCCMSSSKGNILS